MLSRHETYGPNPGLFAYVSQNITAITKQDTKQVIRHGLHDRPLDLLLGLVSVGH